MSLQNLAIGTVILLNIVHLQAKKCVSPNYYYDEFITSNLCISNCQCDGERTCSKYE